MYYACDGICLPYNFYYDANYQIDGCWGDAKEEIKIAVERCGCSAAAKLSFKYKYTICFIIVILIHKLLR